jgi:hypothetical protein
VLARRGEEDSHVIAATLDPEGRRVVLDEHAWTHIKSRHPELTRRLRDVMAAVREPDRRAPGRSSGEGWFFAYIGGALPWLHVAVHYEGGEGWIVTALRRESLPRR